MTPMPVAPWAFYTVLGLAIVLLIYQLHKIIESNDNPIEWWQFISAKGADGKQYADMTKLGQATGIVLCFFITIFLVTKIGTDSGSWLGFCGVLTISLTYLGGVQAYQTYMKSRQGQQPKEPE